jgi:Na+/melibiose symporter-like transporter
VNEDWISRYSYLLLGIISFLFAGIFVYFVVNRRNKNGKRSVFDYLLVWPLLIEQHQKKATKSSKNFILGSLIIMALIIAVGLFIHPEVRN